MRGHRYAALGLFAASAALAADCGFPTSGESSGGTGGSTSTTSSTTTTTTSSSATTGTGPACTAGQTQPCYTGLSGTEGVGTCVGGKQACVNGMWGTCEGEVTSQPQDCASMVDTDCLGKPVACTGTPRWAEGFGSTGSDFINAVAIDSKGNIIVTGGFSDTVNFADPMATPVTKTANADGNNDIFVAKYNGAGTLLWVQFYGGTGEDEGAGVAVDGNDDIVVVGRFASSVDFGSTATSFTGPNAFVAKLASATGSTTWAQAYGGTTQRADAVAVDTSGDVAVVGNFSGNLGFGGTNVLTGSASTDYDGYVVELSSTGTYKWSQDVHGDPGTYPMGFNWLKGVAFDGLGNVVVTGVGTGTTMSFGTGLAPLASLLAGNHVLVGKYSPEGTPLWGQALGNDPPPNTVPRHQGNGITADVNGNIVVTGSFAGMMQFPMGSPLTANGATDIFVAKLDATGNATWSVSYGEMAPGMGMPMGTAADAGNAVALDQFGNVVLAGSFQQNLDASTPPLMAKGATDAFAIKLNPSGTLIWTQGFAADAGSTAYALGVAIIPQPTYVQDVSAGIPVVVGQFGAMMGDTIGFDMLTSLTSAGGSDMFLATLMP
jgi:hypothetical protein